jgi:hypothetical protein
VFLLFKFLILKSFTPLIIEKVNVRLISHNLRQKNLIYNESYNSCSNNNNKNSNINNNSNLNIVNNKRKFRSKKSGKKNKLENLNFGEVITIYKLVQLCYFNFFLHVFFLQIEREDLHLEIVNLLQVAYEHIKVAINKNKSSSTEHCRNFCCGHFEKFNVSTSTDYTEFGRIARAFPQEVGSLYLQNKQKINSYDIFNNIIFNTEGFLSSLQ